MNKQRGVSTIAGLFTVAMMLALVTIGIGWCMNIYTIITTLIADMPITGMVILRVIGIFIGPLGGILGYF